MYISFSFSILPIIYPFLHVVVTAVEVAEYIGAKKILSLSQIVKQIYTSKISAMDNASIFLLSMGVIRHDLYQLLYELKILWRLIFVFSTLRRIENVFVEQKFLLKVIIISEICYVSEISARNFKQAPRFALVQFWNYSQNFIVILKGQPSANREISKGH